MPFAETLAVSRDDVIVDPPARYDERLQVSVTADGEPYVESAGLGLVTITRADGEAVDAPEAFAGSVTVTLVQSEGVQDDDPPQPPPSDRQALVARSAAGEGEDR